MSATSPSSQPSIRLPSAPPFSGLGALPYTFDPVLYRMQFSSLVVPPYRYVASTYLLCFSLLRKLSGAYPKFPFWYSTSSCHPPDPRFPMLYRLSSYSVAHSFALFCVGEKHNSFVFNGFHTLRPKKHRVGERCTSSIWQPASTPRPKLSRGRT